jgi:hypothetical protein
MNFVSEELKLDAGVIVATLEHFQETSMRRVCEPDLKVIRSITEQWKSHRDIVMAAVRLHGPVLQVASAQMRNNRGIVLAAVSAPHDYEENDRRKINAETLALRYASKECRANREVVLAAVRAQGLALKFASMELRAAKDVVREAVLKCPKALKYASDGLRSDRSFLLSVVQQRPDVIRFFSKKCWEDYDFLVDVLLHAPATARFGFMSRCPSAVLDVIDSYPTRCLLDNSFWCGKRELASEFDMSITEAEMWMRDYAGDYCLDEYTFQEELWVEKRRDRRSWEKLWGEKRSKHRRGSKQVNKNDLW